MAEVTEISTEFLRLPSPLTSSPTLTLTTFWNANEQPCPPPTAQSSPLTEFSHTPSTIYTSQKRISTTSGDMTNGPDELIERLERLLELQQEKFRSKEEGVAELIEKGRQAERDLAQEKANLRARCKGLIEKSWQ